MTAIVCQPVSTLPLDGTPVQLVTRFRTADGTDTDRRTLNPFAWNGKVWVSEVTGLPLPGSLTVIGWDRWDDGHE
jgi:hypothetical protein